MDDEELSNFNELVLDHHQSGLHNQNKEEDGRQDGDNPVGVIQGTSVWKWGPG